MREIPELTPAAARFALAWLDRRPIEDVCEVVESAIYECTRTGDVDGVSDLLVLLARFDQGRADALSERTLAEATRIHTRAVLDEIAAERVAQDAKWGDQSGHLDGTGFDGATATAERMRAECDRAAKEGLVTWALILGEEVAEALAETDPGRLRDELVQVAAVATCWIEALDRRPSTEEQLR